MFKHAKFKKMLSSYLDNQLTPREIKLVEDHLAKCKSCNQYLENLQKLTAKLKSWQDAEITPDLELRIRNDFLGAKYKGVAKMKTPNKILIGVTSGALAVLVLFVFAQGYFNRAINGNLKQPAASVGDQFVTYDKSIQASRSVLGIGRVEEDQYSRQGFSTGKLCNEELKKKESYYHGADVSGKIYASAPRSQTEPRDRREIMVASKLKRESSGSREYDEKKESKKVRDYEYVYKRDSKTWRSKKSPTGATSKEIDAVSFSQDGLIIVRDVYLPATGQEEKVIRTANIKVEVNNVESAYDAVAEISKERGGYLATVNFKEKRNYEGQVEKTSATLIIRIPKEKLEETLDAIKKLGEVSVINVTSNDVSMQHAALVTEFNTTKVIYDKLRKQFESRKNTINDAIQWESQLTPYEKKLASIKSQIAELDNLIAMSTVTINLFTSPFRYDVNLTLEVDSLAVSYELLAKLAKETRGYVISGNINETDPKKARAYLSLRVPLSDVEAFISSAKKQGETKQFNSSSKNLWLKNKPGQNKTFSKEDTARIHLNLTPSWKYMLKHNSAKFWQDFLSSAGKSLPKALVVMLIIIILGSAISFVVGKFRQNKSNR